MTLRLAEGLAERGWRVEWFSAAYPGAASEETRGGIRYVRAGSQVSVHYHAFRRYHRHRDISIVVDEVNTIPFFTPLYLRRVPKVALFYQLAKEVWLYETSRAIGWLGYFLEPFYLLPYRHVSVATISRSSVDSMRKIGFCGPIIIVPIAVDEVADEVVPEKKIPRDVVVISRLAPSKRIEHAIEAAIELDRTGWRGALRIVGAGDEAYVAKLRALASGLPASRIIFEGRVTKETKRDLLRSSSVLWMTSVREGWGLVVTEAARHWTPSVVYDVPGLRDAVIDGVTGRIVSPNPKALAFATKDLLEEWNEKFARNALLHSRGFSWARSTDVFADALVAEMLLKH